MIIHLNDTQARCLEILIQEYAEQWSNGDWMWDDEDNQLGKDEIDKQLWNVANEIANHLNNSRKDSR